MKFRTSVFLVIIGILIIAYFTKPSTEDFRKFRDAEDNASGPPVIEMKDGYVYSVYTVSHYNIKELPKVKMNDKGVSVAVPVSKEKFLGLFGRFWKID